MFSAVPQGGYSAAAPPAPSSHQLYTPPQFHTQSQGLASCTPTVPMPRPAQVLGFLRTTPARKLFSPLPLGEVDAASGRLGPQVGGGWGCGPGAGLESRCCQQHTREHSWVTPGGPLQGTARS